MAAELNVSVAFVIGLLAAALVIGLIAERIHIPYTVALVLASLPLNGIHSGLQFSPSLLIVFLPPLIFEAAWNLDARALRRTWRPIAMLAVPGVVFTAVVIGGGLYAAQRLPFSEALLLGTIVAATDPVAVIAIFRELAVPIDLATTVEGESLANDGVAVVLYAALVAAMAAGPEAFHPGRIAWRAAVASLGGAAIGFAAAFLLAQALRGIANAMLQIVGTVVLAYGAYLIADTVGVSGIFAAAVAGIALRSFEYFPQPSAVADVDQFWAVQSFFANTLVFLLMGLRISFDRILHEPLLVGLTLVLVAAARIALAYGGLSLFAIHRERGAWKHVVALAGIRGALSLALALGLPESVPHRAQIIDAVFGVVLVTLVAQGIAIGPVLARLRL